MVINRSPTSITITAGGMIPMRTFALCVCTSSLASLRGEEALPGGGVGYGRIMVIDSVSPCPLTGCR